MAFEFKINKNVEFNKSDAPQGGNKYITTSGIYPVTIKRVSVQNHDSGTTSLTFTMNYEGSEITCYNMFITNRDGSQHFKAKIFNNLCIIADVDNIDTEVQSVNLPSGVKDLEVIPAFEDVEVNVAIKYIYSKYNGSIKEAREIAGFYRKDDFAVGYEILGGDEVGSRYSKDEKYMSVNTYRDGLTAEEVQAWKDDKKTLKSGQAPKAEPTTQASNPFANPFA